MAKIKQAKKHTGRPQKEQIVAELVEKLDNSNALVLADYQGLTHIQLEDLKKELKKLDSTIVIAKNSLLKISLGKSKNFADYKDNQNLDRPTAALFMQADYAEPLKKLAKVIKAFGLPKIKLGILEGQALDEAGVLKIALLPNREALLTMLVGTLNSPIRGLAVTLNGNIQKFVMVLNAIAQTKPSATSNQQLTESEPVASSQQLEGGSSEPDQTNTQTDQVTPATTPSTEIADETPTEQVETKTDDQVIEGGEKTN